MGGEIENDTGKSYQETRREYKEARRKNQLRERGTKRVVFWSAIVFLLAGGAYAMTNLGAGTIGLKAKDLTDNVGGSNQMKGKEGATITLTEYSDFQCPACKAYHPILKQVFSDYGDRIIFEYRHFPLRMTHFNAEIAARAAEAAGRQGKFWEMHDLLFENQDTWAELSFQEAGREFASYAQTLGLDMTRFANDIDADEVKNIVSADYESGLASGVGGTPTFFLNGKAVTNPQSYDGFKELIDGALVAPTP